MFFRRARARVLVCRIFWFCIAIEYNYYISKVFQNKQTNMIKGSLLYKGRDENDENDDVRYY